MTDGNVIGFAAGVNQIIELIKLSNEISRVINITLFLRGTSMSLTKNDSPFNNSVIIVETFHSKTTNVHCML